MDIPVDLCLEMLMAADFLGIESESRTSGLISQGGRS